MRVLQNQKPSECSIRFNTSIPFSVSYVNIMRKHTSVPNFEKHMTANMHCSAAGLSILGVNNTFYVLYLMFFVMLWSIHFPKIGEKYAPILTTTEYIRNVKWKPIILYARTWCWDKLKELYASHITILLSTSNILFVEHSRKNINSNWNRKKILCFVKARVCNCKHSKKAALYHKKCLFWSLLFI